jgi:repressor of nif and glnA expression
LFLADLMRRDTMLLHLMTVAGGPTGSGELADALQEVGIDAESKNIIRDLKNMQEKALVTFHGFTLRGCTRMRLYVMTDLGRATVNRRMGAVRALLLDPPTVRDVAAQQLAAGWH